MSDFLSTVRERVVIYDGGMGSMVQARTLSVDDFWGKPDCTEVLVLSRPDVVREIHAAYFDAGADVVETNSFNANRIMLAESGLQDKAHEINRAAAKVAREVAAEYSNGRKRFV